MTCGSTSGSSIVNCICKPGYNGTNCSVRNYCNYPDACPANSTCVVSNDGLSYSCECPGCDHNACMNYKDHGNPGPPEDKQTPTVDSPAPLILIISGMLFHIMGLYCTHVLLIHIADISHLCLSVWSLSEWEHNYIIMTSYIHNIDHCIKWLRDSRPHAFNDHS